MSPRSPLTPRRLLALAAILAAAALIFLLRPGASRPSEDALLAHPPHAPLPASHALSPLPAPSPASSPSPSSSPDGQTLWQKRLARSQRTLDTYLEANRYPPTSRPISEQPDTAQPHFVADQKVRLLRKDQKITDARATLKQDRYYLVADERAALSITCENTDGPAPCEVVSTMARAEGSAAQTTVPFTPGEAGSVVASFQPSTQGFAAVHGPIRVFVDLRVDGEEGQVSFEVMFTPTAPATFTGAVREALEGGSLDLFVELKVDHPGRYVITARADDADGHPFAYLSFNDELAAGRQEAKLPLFGKLVLDAKAKSPFHLRDVEGFLLLPDTFPDRELMRSLLGEVHVTKRYTDRDLSDREWQSDEKDRHVKQFTADVEEAKQHVVAGD